MKILQAKVCCAGIACSDAHSRAELRAEAAVLHGNKHYTYRFSLCENFYRNNQCPRGILCDQAHGIDEVRQATSLDCPDPSFFFATFIADLSLFVAITPRQTCLAVAL